MSTVTHIYDAIDRLAPFWLTMDFDNTGILIGDRNREVSCALLALDCTPAVVEQARQLGAQLIITHHPVIFHPLKRVNEDAVVYLLIRSDIAVISAHTNLDIAQGGVNDALASAIGPARLQGAGTFKRADRRLAWPHRHAAGAALPRSVCRPHQSLSQRLQRQICRRAASYPHRRALFRLRRGLSGRRHLRGGRRPADLGGQAARISGCHSSRHQHL